MASRLAANAIRLYTSETAAGLDLYPGKIGERVPRTQTSVWERRVVTGPVSADAESLLSSWTQDDYSGGFGIVDANETTDTSRIAFGLIDGRRPKSMCLPPLTELIPSPTWVETGSFWPLGDIGTQFYGAWANGISGYNTATDLWHTTQNAWPAGFAPVNEAVSFCGKLYVPGGSTGIAILSELTAATGTLTVSHLSSNFGVTAVALGLHDGKLWAIDTANKLWMLTVYGATLDPTTVGSWGPFDKESGTTGTEVKDVFDNSVILDTGVTPTELFSWFNSGQKETLWCVTRGQGAYLFDPGQAVWIKSRIKEGAHPDWGLASEVFRDGEDVFIAGGGLDLTRFTIANVEVPISGPSKDQGVPPEYQGTIVDLLSERSSLYALVDAGTSVAAGAPTSTWTLQQIVGGIGAVNGLFQSPQQVAVDSSGNVYVADRDNNRVQKFTSAGVYSGAITGLTAPVGVCVNAAGTNLWIAHGLRIDRYTTGLVFETNVKTFDGGGALRHIAPGNINLYFTRTGQSGVQVMAYAGGDVYSLASSTDCVGVATDATYVYFVDRTNNLVRKYVQATDVLDTSWGSAGTANGQFDDPTGICLDDSGDVWVCDYGNQRLQRFSNAGVYQTKFAHSTPVGIGRATGDILWVSSAQHNLRKWDEVTVSSPAVAARSWLGAWTGTAWCALWDAADTVVPTWMRVSLTGDHALWWGDSNGVAYRQLLPPPFFNPASRVILGAYPFAATGWMESIRYDANMSGWDKIASHFFAMLDYAGPDTYVDISYRTDADQFDSGLLDPPYRAWKRIDRIGRVLAWFDDTTVDAFSGLPRHEGEPFQWIQFRYDFVRGDDTFKSPIWMWHSLHHLSVPQDSASFVLKIPLAAKEAKPFKRSPDEMAETLRALQTTRKMVHLQTRNADPDHPEWKVFFRGRVTAVKSEFYVGANNNLDEIMVVNFVELGASSNEFTTVAP